MCCEDTRHALIECREPAPPDGDEHGILVGEVVVGRARRDIESLGDCPERDMVCAVLADCVQGLFHHRLGEGPVVVTATHDTPVSATHILTSFIFRAKVRI